MMNSWWLLAIISGLGLATRNLSFKAAGNQIDAAFAALILSIAMTAITLGYYVIQRTTVGAPMIPDAVPMKPALLCVLAGAGVAGANIFLALAYKQGGYASLTAILQNGFSICVTILLGFLLLSEVIRPMQLLGIMVTFAGMVMVTKS
ncbi:MAG: EamA family transporter [Pseudomonadota bacterium]